MEINQANPKGNTMMNNESRSMALATDEERQATSQRAYSMIMQIVRELKASEEDRSTIVHQIVLIENAAMWSGFDHGYKAGIEVAEKKIS